MVETNVFIMGRMKKDELRLIVDIAFQRDNIIDTGNQVTLVVEVTALLWNALDLLGWVRNEDMSGVAVRVYMKLRTSNADCSKGKLASLRERSVEYMKHRGARIEEGLGVFIPLDNDTQCLGPPADASSVVMHPLSFHGFGLQPVMTVMTDGVEKAIKERPEVVSDDELGRFCRCVQPLPPIEMASSALPMLAHVASQAAGCSVVPSQSAGGNVGPSQSAGSNVGPSQAAGGSVGPSQAAGGSVGPSQAEVGPRWSLLPMHGKSGFAVRNTKSIRLQNIRKAGTGYKVYGIVGDKRPRADEGTGVQGVDARPKVSAKKVCQNDLVEFLVRCTTEGEYPSDSRLGNGVGKIGVVEDICDYMAPGLFRVEDGTCTVMSRALIQLMGDEKMIPALVHLYPGFGDIGSLKGDKPEGRTAVKNAIAKRAKAPDDTPGRRMLRKVVKAGSGTDDIYLYFG